MESTTATLQESSQAAGAIRPPAGPDILEFQPLPDHTQLPETDGAIVENFLELPQSILLTTSIEPHLRQRHPDGNFAIASDSGIYFWPTDPPLRGCKAPDWFYIPDVPQTLDNQPRRSYVMWKELVPPMVLIEYVSGDGSEERDRTRLTGKFWVYENCIRPAYYVIYEPFQGKVEAYHLVENRFESLPTNERGHFPLPRMGVEVGIWEGWFLNQTWKWLRFWDLEGRLIPTPNERAEQERQRAEQAERQLVEERQRVERLAERLRALGGDPT